MLDEPGPGPPLPLPSIRPTRPGETAGETAAGDSSEFVQSLERGLSVIRAFDAEHPG